MVSKILGPQNLPIRRHRPNGPVADKIVATGMREPRRLISFGFLNHLHNLVRHSQQGRKTLQNHRVAFWLNDAWFCPITE